MKPRRANVPSPDLPPPEAGATEAFTDGGLYDAEYRNYKRDIDFYRRNVGKLLGGPGEVLELACGSGRVTTGLALDGHHVFGFDLSASMVRRATARVDRLPRESRSRVHLFQADMRQFATSRRFAVAVCAFNSFEHLYEPRDVAACLACVRTHLARDGILLFDVHNPEPRVLARSATKTWSRRKFRDNEGQWVERSMSSSYDRERQIHHVTMRYQPLADDKQTQRGPAFQRRLSQRQFWPIELDALLATSGFDVELKLGEFDNQLFSGDSPSQIVFCRPQ